MATLSDTTLYSTRCTLGYQALDGYAPVTVPNRRYDLILSTSASDTSFPITVNWVLKVGDDTSSDDQWYELKNIDLRLNGSTVYTGDDIQKKKEGDLISSGSISVNSYSFAVYFEGGFWKNDDKSCKIDTTVSVSGIITYTACTIKSFTVASSMNYGSSITLNWEGQDGTGNKVSGYTLKANVNNAGWETLLNKKTSTSYTYTADTDGSVIFSLQAFGSHSGYDSAESNKTVIINPVAPEAVTSLLIQSDKTLINREATISCTWNKPASGSSRNLNYSVDVFYTDNSVSLLSKSVNSTSTSFKINDLSSVISGKEIFVRVTPTANPMNKDNNSLLIGNYTDSNALKILLPIKVFFRMPNTDNNGNILNWLSDKWVETTVYFTEQPANSINKTWKNVTHRLAFRENANEPFYPPIE